MAAALITRTGKNLPFSHCGGINRQLLNSYRNTARRVVCGLHRCPSPWLVVAAVPYPAVHPASSHPPLWPAHSTPTHLLSSHLFDIAAQYVRNYSSVRGAHPPEPRTHPLTPVLFVSTWKKHKEVVNLQMLKNKHSSDSLKDGSFKWKSEEKEKGRWTRCIINIKILHERCYGNVRFHLTQGLEAFKN